MFQRTNFWFCCCCFFLLFVSSILQISYCYGFLLLCLPFVGRNSYHCFVYFLFISLSLILCFFIMFKDISLKHGFIYSSQIVICCFYLIKYLNTFLISCLETCCQISTYLEIFPLTHFCYWYLIFLLSESILNMVLSAFTFTDVCFITQHIVCLWKCFMCFKKSHVFYVDGVFYKCQIDWQCCFRFLYCD